MRGGEENANFGFISETKFCVKAQENGIDVFAPVFKSHGTIDVMAFKYAVQIKSSRITAKGAQNSFRFDIYRRKRRIKKKRAFNDYGDEIDFFALHISMYDIWYIIPRQEVDKKSIFINLKKDRYEKYRENWNLLK